MDRGTTPAIAYSLARIAAIDADAVVGVFPADHHFTDEASFAASLERAYRHGALSADTLVLLGASPEYAEVEYGWIEPGGALARIGGTSVFQVKRFWEKPSADLACGLLDRGCLWNTFVMVGRVRTFLDVIRESVCAVSSAFAALSEGEDSDGTEHWLDRVYDGLAAGDFSKQVLSALPDRLAVLRLDNVGWSDLGTPERVTEARKRVGLKPLTAA